MSYVLPIAHNCDQRSDGRPLCGLPLVRDPKGRPFCHCPHLKGASAYEVVRKSRDFDLIDRKYRIMFVGEAPGRQEDETGMPFVGDAGDILKTFLTTAGFDLFEGYVTNLVKCRPPKNRNPSVAEIRDCKIHIDHEIRMFRPKVIMLLGNVPLRLFNLHNQGGIGAIHGTLFERTLPGWDDGPVFKVIPTYHPAAFIHRDQPQLKRRVLDDYVFAKKVLDSEDTPLNPYHEAPYTLCDTIEKVSDMVNQVLHKGRFAFDTESPDLHIMRSPMICAQFSLGKGKTWVLPFYRHDPEGLDFKLRPHWSPEDKEKVRYQLAWLFANPHIVKAAHNIKYDWRVILRWLGLRINGFLWDTQCLHHILDEYAPHNLEYLSDIEFGTGNYGEKVHEITGKGRKLIATYDNVPDSILWQYGATDAESTARLLEIYLQRIMQRPHLLDLYKTQTLPTIYTLAKCEWGGSKMDMGVVDQLGKRFESELNELTSKCRALSKPDFNPGSPEQVVDLFKSLGLEKHIRRPDKPTGYSTDKDTLQPLQDEYPVAKYILDYRHSKKMRTTYIDNVLKDIDDDGRLRYSFNVSGTTSGRLSCTFFHQVPNIDEEMMERGEAVMRDMFTIEGGNVYFYGDYSQIEFKIWAILAGEEKLIELFKDPRTDMHTLTAAAALDIPVEQVSAYNRGMVGKPVNFAIVYGSEGMSISKGDYEDPEKPGRYYHLDLKTMQKFIKRFKREYQQIDFYQQYIPELARSQGCMLRSVFDRERHIIGLNSPDRKLRGEAERQAVNFTIQNPAAEITLGTMNRVDAVIDQNHLGVLEKRKVLLLNSVHDSLSYEVATYLAPWFAQSFKIVAERPIPQLKGASFSVKCGYYNGSWARAEMAAV